MAAPGNMPDICGLMTYSNAWDDAMPVMGVYTVPTNANQSFELVFPAEESYAGVALDGIYYATDFISIEGIGIMISIAGYDLESGEKLFPSNRISMTAFLSASLPTPIHMRFTECSTMKMAWESSSEPYHTTRMNSPAP